MHYQVGNNLVKKGPILILFRLCISSEQNSIYFSLAMADI